MNQYLGRLNRNHLMYGGGALLVVVSLFTGGIDNIKSGNVRGNALQERRAEIQDRQDEFVFDQKEAEVASQAAIQRYKDGCVFVVGLGAPDTAVSIIQGEPVLDATTLQPLPDNTVVCGFNGTTGIIKNEVVDSVAFTGNKDVVDMARERAGFHVENSSTGHRFGD